MKCIEKYNYFNYLEGSIQAEDKLVFELHYKHCGECQNALIQLQKTIEVINVQKEIKANPFLYTRISEKLNEGNIEPVKLKVLKPVIVTAIAIFSMIIGITIGSYLTNTNSLSNTSGSMHWNELEQENIEMTLLTNN
jgi:hypothetical protein